MQAIVGDVQPDYSTGVVFAAVKSDCGDSDVVRDQLLDKCVFKGGQIIIYVASRPTAAQFEGMVGDIAKLVIDFFLFSVPGRPEIGKWTKDPPAVDWATAVMALLPFERLVRNAYHHIKVSVTSDQITSEMSFHEAAGVQCDCGFY